MGQELLSPEWDCYFDTFVRDAHQLLAWGYEGVKDRIQSDDEETKITSLIVAEIEHRLNDPNTPDYYDKYEPHENKPDNKTGRVGKRRLLPDITIRFSGRRPRPEFTFEAKRLKANGFPIGEYVGKHGLQCFLRGDYACDCEAAAMVAYIQSDTPDHWFRRLDDRFRKDVSAKLRIKTALQPVSVLQSLPYEWVSEHERDDNSRMKMFHIFLDCCGCKSQAC